MSESQQTITYTDPRFFDGEPFEVAEKAVRQAEEAVELSQRALNDAEVMARNAELERQLIVGDECDASTWPTSAQGRQYATIRERVEKNRRILALLRQAAAFNPRARVTQETLTNGN
jgi:hypothetical protein